MMPLTYLANLCSQIDHTYSVSLQYGAHAGEKPCWALVATIPAHNIRMARSMANLKNILVEAHALGCELQCLISLNMAVKRGEETLSLDSYQATQGDNHSPS